VNRGGEGGQKQSCCSDGKLNSKNNSNFDRQNTFKKRHLSIRVNQVRRKKNVWGKTRGEIRPRRQVSRKTWGKKSGVKGTYRERRGAGKADQGTPDQRHISRERKKKNDEHERVKPKNESGLGGGFSAGSVFRPGGPAARSCQKMTGGKGNGWKTSNSERRTKKKISLGHTRESRGKRQRGPKKSPAKVEVGSGVGARCPISQHHISYLQQRVCQEIVKTRWGQKKKLSKYKAVVKQKMNEKKKRENQQRRGPENLHLALKFPNESPKRQAKKK